MKILKDPTYEEYGLSPFLTRILQPPDKKYMSSEDFDTRVEDATVKTSKLAGKSVATEKINDQAVITEKIEDSNITTAKIAASAVTDEKVSDVKTNKIQVAASSVASVNVWELFYLGLIDQAITGGEVDGDPYVGYILDIIIYHSFSSWKSGAIPFYEVYGYSDSAVGTEMYANELVDLTVTGGSSTQTTSHFSYLFNDGVAAITEYIDLRWVVDWVSGTVTIGAQDVKAWLAIKYARTLDANVPAGGGGGDDYLHETIEVYL